MKKSALFRCLFLSNLVIFPTNFLITSCDDNAPKPKIIEPTNKTFYSNTTYEDDVASTHILIGMFFLKNMSDANQIVVKAVESDGLGALGDLVASLIVYDQNIFYIDLEIENINCYAWTYQINLDFYLNNQLIQSSKNYNLVINTEIFQINNNVKILSNWNTDETKIDYTFQTSIIKVFHPALSLRAKDFNFNITYVSPEVKNLEITNSIVKNVNEIELTINLTGNEFICDWDYYLNLEITYTPLELTKIYYYTLSFDENGWDDLIPQNSKNLKIVRPSDPEDVFILTIKDFVLTGFNEEIKNIVKIYDYNSSSIISNLNPIFKKQFEQTDLPKYTLQIPIKKDSPQFENLQIMIKIDDGYQLCFSKGYYLTIY